MFRAGLAVCGAYVALLSLIPMMSRWKKMGLAHDMTT